MRYVKERFSEVEGANLSIVQCGCDRTGEISGSYYMTYMNMSLKQAHDLDMKIAGREIST